jgi:ABC-2 type transport system permease protein
MAVYERAYTPYEGPRSRLSTRFMVIPRFALQEIARSRLFLISLVMALMNPVIVAIVIYLHHNAGALTVLQIDVSDIISIDSFFFFFTLLRPHQWIAVWMALIVGTSLMTSDLAGGALPLYLSRPLRRRDYIIGKSMVLVVLLSAVTWVPGVLLWFFQASLVGGTWASEHMHVLFSLIVVNMVWIVVLTLLTLALSAWVRWRPVAGLLLLGVLTVPVPFARIANEIFDMKTDWAILLSPSDLIGVIRAGMLGDSVPSWAYLDLPNIPPASAWFMLSLLALASLGLLFKKVQAFAVVK